MRKTSVYEKILLVVGLLVIVLGFYYINTIITSRGAAGWELLQTVLIWVILIIVIVATAALENVKEELNLVIKEQVRETKLLKQIINDQLVEIKLLRKDMKKK